MDKLWFGYADLRKHVLVLPREVVVRRAAVELGPSQNIAAHRFLPGGGVTVVYANSEAPIPNPINVPMHEHSLVILRNGRPVVHHDFEKPRILSVERSSRRKTVTRSAT